MSTTKYALALTLALVAGIACISRTYAIRPLPKEPVKPLPQVERLIKCESSGVNQTIRDSNGKFSRGILMFQETTWDWFSRKSGIKGHEVEPDTAIKMANWAVKNGYGPHWTCWHLLHLSYQNHR